MLGNPAVTFTIFLSLVWDLWFLTNFKGHRADVLSKVSPSEDDINTFISASAAGAAGAMLLVGASLWFLDLQEDPPTWQVLVTPVVVILAIVTMITLIKWCIEVNKRRLRIP